MDVLKETYQSDKTSNTVKDNRELPGGLSFSIRELPDEDIEKVIDSGSIYALDFLRLQYTAPPWLDEILTPSAMKLYDGVFKFLLRLLRVLYVTTKIKASLATDQAHQQSWRSRSNMRSGFEAHRFISLFMAHIMDIGIEAPWQRFIASIAQVEKVLDNDSSADAARPDAIGLEGLRRLHEELMERIRNRLFLRRKQEKIQKAIENVMAAILRDASAFENVEDVNDNMGSTPLRESIAELTRHLRATVNKPSKTGDFSHATESDSEATKLLLQQLGTGDVHEDMV